MTQPEGTWRPGGRAAGVRSKAWARAPHAVFLGKLSDRLDRLTLDALVRIVAHQAVERVEDLVIGPRSPSDSTARRRTLVSLCRRASSISLGAAPSKLAIARLPVRPRRLFFFVVPPNSSSALSAWSVPRLPNASIA